MTAEHDGEPTTWTLGAVKAQGLDLDGKCSQPGCGGFASFDLDALIEAAGAEYVMPELIPQVSCPLCGGRLKFVLGTPHGGPGDGNDTP